MAATVPEGELMTYHAPAIESAISTTAEMLDHKHDNGGGGGAGSPR
jgi:hypothetical protein